MHQEFFQSTLKIYTFRVLYTKSNFYKPGLPYINYRMIGLTSIKNFKSKVYYAYQSKDFNIGAKWNSEAQK